MAGAAGGEVGERPEGDRHPTGRPGPGLAESLMVISVIGRGSVTIDGEPAKFATRHAELMVYLLALAGRDGLGRDDLSDTLWPGVEPPAARPRLRTALWQVRRALGDHAWRIERERGSVMLVLDGAELDLSAGRSIGRNELLIGHSFEIPAALAERVA